MKVDDFDILFEIRLKVGDIENEYIRYYYYKYYDFESKRNLKKKQEMLHYFLDGGEIYGKGYEHLFEKLKDGAEFIEGGIKLGNEEIKVIIM